MRIKSLSIDKWDPELREILQIDLAALPDVHREILGVYANAPRLAQAFFSFESAFWKGFTLRNRLLELMRLRIAFHNQCRSCMAMRRENALEDGLTENLVCSLEKPSEAPDLTAAERVAVQFADAFAVNHLSIDDEAIDNLRNYYSEQEIVELCMACSFFVGFGRFAAIYKAIENLPESYQDMSSPTSPWSATHTERIAVTF